jgi:RNA recognition motif-containing protein
MNREVAANEAARRSKKECRVYVGNLSFNVRWNDLKDFMREGGFRRLNRSRSRRE